MFLFLNILANNEVKKIIIGDKILRITYAMLDKDEKEACGWKRKVYP
jgi:hypothetical protein